MRQNWRAMGSNREFLELVKEQQRRKARTDFATFRKIINPKLKWGWWQYKITAELQQFYEDLADGLRPMLVIQAPPQHGKSLITVEFVAWASGRNPDNRTIYASFSDDLGARANSQLQRIYTSEEYPLIFPSLKIGKTEEGVGILNQSKIEYVGAAGGFENTTVRGSITGRSLDLGVIDDPIRGRQDANSKTVRDATWNWFTDDFFTRFSDMAGMLIVLTRWHIDDPVGRLVAEFGKAVKVCTYPAIAEEDEEFRKAGEALFPEHKTLEFLEKRQKLMSASNWLALYQQRPTAQEGDIFEPDKMEIVREVPGRILRMVRGWDMAGTTKGDYTVGVLLGVLEDKRYIILDVVRMRVKTHERDAEIKKTVNKDGRGVKQSFPQDPGSAGKSQIAYLGVQLAGGRIVSSLETGNKEVRAEGVASQVNIGNVIMLLADWNNRLIDELRHFPGGLNDDQVDALARAFNEAMRGRSIYESN